MSEIGNISMRWVYVTFSFVILLREEASKSTIDLGSCFVEFYDDYGKFLRLFAVLGVSIITYQLPNCKRETEKTKQG